jgi:hypothetical protein
MEEAEEDETFSVHEAKKHYTSLKNCQVVTLNSCSNCCKHTESPKHLSGIESKKLDICLKK